MLNENMTFNENRCKTPSRRNKDVACEENTNDFIHQISAV